MDSTIEAADIHPLDAVLTTNEAFMLIFAVILGSMSYILDKIYKKNLKLFWLIIFFPPVILWASYKYRTDLKQGLVYIGAFLIFTFLLALLTRMDYFSELMYLVKIISFWPYYLATFITNVLLPVIRLGN